MFARVTWFLAFLLGKLPSSVRRVPGYRGLLGVMTHQSGLLTLQNKKLYPAKREILVRELACSETLAVHTETVRLSGQCTIALVEKLVSVVTDLTTEVARLKSGNAILKTQISDLLELFSSRSGHLEAAVGDLSSKPRTP
jgi:hypothetical protein